MQSVKPFPIVIVFSCLSMMVIGSLKAQENLEMDPQKILRENAEYAMAYGEFALFAKGMSVGEVKAAFNATLRPLGQEVVWVDHDVFEKSHFKKELAYHYVGIGSNERGVAVSYDSLLKTDVHSWEFYSNLVRRLKGPWVIAFGGYDDTWEIFWGSGLEKDGVFQFSPMMTELVAEPTLEESIREYYSDIDEKVKSFASLFDVSEEITRRYIRKWDWEIDEDGLFDVAEVKARETDEYSDGEGLQKFDLLRAIGYPDVTEYGYFRKAESQD